MATSLQSKAEEDPSALSTLGIKGPRRQTGRQTNIIERVLAEAEGQANKSDN